MYGSVICVLQEFSANHNADEERYQYLTSPFIARFVRFHPIEWHRHVSMRAGLLGCPHTGLSSLYNHRAASDVQNQKYVTHS